MSFLVQRRTLAAAAGSSMTNVALLAAATIGGIASARDLGPTGRGQLAALFVWAAVIQTASLLGLPNAFTYLTARWPDDSAGATRHLLRLYPRQLALAISAYVALSQGLLRLDSSSTLVFCAWMSASMLTTIAVSYAHGAGQFRSFNMLRLIAGAGTGVGLAVVSVLATLTVFQASLLYLAAALATLPTTLCVLGRAVASGDRRFTRADELWNYSRRNVAGVISTTANARVDQLVLTFSSSSRLLGLYAVAATASTTVIPIISGVASVGFNKVASTADTRAQASIVRRMLLFATLVALAANVVFVAAAPLLIPLMFGPEFSGAVGPARVLACGAVFVAWNLVLCESLRACNAPGAVGWSEVAGAVATASCVALAIPHGLMWVGGASAGGYGVSTLVAGRELSRRLRNPTQEHGEAPVRAD